MGRRGVWPIGYTGGGNGEGGRLGSRLLDMLSGIIHSTALAGGKCSWVGVWCGQFYAFFLLTVSMQTLYATQITTSVDCSHRYR